MVKLCGVWVWQDLHVLLCGALLETVSLCEEWELERRVHGRRGVEAFVEVESQCEVWVWEWGW